MTPPVTEELASLICRPLFPHQRGYTPAVSEDAGLILTLGSLYLGVVGRVEQPDLERLWEVIAGADIVDELLRNAILGRPFEPPPPVIPDYLDVFVRQNCFAGVLQAQLGFALALQAWAPSSNSDGISEIEPGTGCDGDTVVIRGTGFGRSHTGSGGVVPRSRRGLHSGQGPSQRVVTDGHRGRGALECWHRLRRFRLLR